MKRTISSLTAISMLVRDRRAALCGRPFNPRLLKKAHLSTGANPGKPLC